MIPLHTHVYQRNYGPAERGLLFSRTNLLRILCGSAAGWLIGIFLERGLLGRHTLLLGYAAAAGVAAACLFRLPTGRFDGLAVPNPLRSFRRLCRDRFFSATLVYWMLMGFGVLMMLPSRVEYLANPAHGRACREEDIALLVTIIPNAGRIVGNPLWGRTAKAEQRLRFPDLWEDAARKLLARMTERVGSSATRSTGRSRTSPSALRRPFATSRPASARPRPAGR